MKIIMGIRVYHNWKMNFNSKNGRKRSFSYETKASVHLSQWVEWIWSAQSLKKGGYYVYSCLSKLERKL